MTLEQFAIQAGVEIVECGKEIAYSTKDSPNLTVTGFRTKKSAYKNWLENTFGNHAARTVLKLLKEAK